MLKLPSRREREYAREVREKRSKYPLKNNAGHLKWPALTFGCFFFACIFMRRFSVSYEMTQVKPFWCGLGYTACILKMFHSVIFCEKSLSKRWRKSKITVNTQNWLVFFSAIGAINAGLFYELFLLFIVWFILSWTVSVRLFELNIVTRLLSCLKLKLFCRMHCADRWWWWFTVNARCITIGVTDIE